MPLLLSRHAAWPLGLAAAIGAAPAWPEPATAAVIVRVVGIAAGGGEIGCSLFGAGTGFPMDSGNARQRWLPAREGSVTCRFDDVPEGTWAVAVAHDLNGNHQVDTNFLGMPTEAWGVSNNVRPRLRAPRFEEAAFKVEAGRTVAFEVEVAK